jgi:uncharacterized protein YuzE
MRLDYDEEADVLYLHFEDRPGSTHSEMGDDGVILDYKGHRLVGVTILEASQRCVDFSLAQQLYVTLQNGTP